MKQNSLDDVIIEDQDPEEIFEILDLLGQGAYGSVSKALHKPTGQLVAIKIVSNSNDEVSNIKKQIIILRDCSSQYIVKFYGAYYKDNNLWIVMEYCVAGSAIDIIRITKKELTECEIASILQAVLRGLEYLHSNKIIHRDVKAGNVLLDHKGNAKLADFGVSAEIVNTHAHRKTFIGSPYWMSPEILSQSTYDKKTDIWSLGITAIELAEGAAPYSNMHPMRAMWVIKHNPVKGLQDKAKWSEDFQSFIASCLNSQPNERPAAKDLLSHPFIVKKAKGRAILSELVLNSMDAIQKYRIKQSKKRFSSEDNNQNSLQIKFVEQKRDTIRMDASQSKQQEQVYDSGTLVIKDTESEGSQIKSPTGDEKKNEPQFMKFAKRMREVDEVYHNKQKFIEYLQKKESASNPTDTPTKPSIASTVTTVPTTSAEIIKRIAQLDKDCESQIKQILEKHRKKVDEQVSLLKTQHNVTYLKDNLKCYNLSFEKMSTPAKKANEIRNINNINSINISITEKKELKTPAKTVGCLSCEKAQEKQAFKKSKKFKQFVDDSEVFEYLKQNYLSKKP